MAKPRKQRQWATSRRWTEQLARDALAALEDSGESLAAFASREGLSAGRLYRWRARLGEQSAPAFVEIRPRECAGEHRSGVFEVVVRSGRMVRVPSDFDALSLQRLLAVIEADLC